MSTKKTNAGYVRMSFGERRTPEENVVEDLTVTTEPTAMVTTPEELAVIEREVLKIKKEFLAQEKEMLEKLSEDLEACFSRIKFDLIPLSREKLPEDLVMRGVKE